MQIPFGIRKGKAPVIVKEHGNREESTAPPPTGGIDTTTAKKFAYKQQPHCTQQQVATARSLENAVGGLPVMIPLWHCRNGNRRCQKTVSRRKARCATGISSAPPQIVRLPVCKIPASAVAGEIPFANRGRCGLQDASNA